MDLLAKLNRLRVNAGKTELKSWKASKDKMIDAIDALQKAGFVDVVPGANIDAAPVAEDKALEEAAKAPPATPPVKKMETSLARGAGADGYTAHSRKAISDQKSKARQEKKEEKLPKGQVDPKVDPEKAARQKKHIEDKQAARAAAGKTAKPKAAKSDEVTVADIARELGIAPKIARAKLRRHEAKINGLHTKGQDRWTFPSSAKKVLVDILNGEK